MATTTGGPYVLNIVELQNTMTSASGLTPTTILSNAIANIQEMVIYDEKRIAVNTISQFNTTPIQVVDSINFASNTSLTLDGIAVSAGGGSGSFSQVSSIGYASSFTNYYSTLTAADIGIAFQVGSPPVLPLTVTAGGTTSITGNLVLSGAGTPAIGSYLTCMDALGTAEWQPPGSVSDARWKGDIRQIENADSILQTIRGVRFSWNSSGSNDIGVIAQDLLPALPEAVNVGIGEQPHTVHYHKIIPVLVEAVKALQERVKILENR